MQLVTEDNITELAKARWATAHDPRTRELLTGLVQHLHDFAREVRLTEAEWMAAVQWLTRTGQISDEKREEFILASDVLGLSMLVVQMNHQFDPGATPATVLGPFHIDGSPELGYAADMSEGLPGVPLFISGTVRGLDGTPIGGAVLDVWQADEDGAYEAQLPVEEGFGRRQVLQGRMEQRPVQRTGIDRLFAGRSAGQVHGAAPLAMVPEHCEWRRRRRFQRSAPAAARGKNGTPDGAAASIL